MAKTSNSSGNQVTITVQVHEVTLHFSAKANTQVATQIRQAILGVYLLKNSNFIFLLSIILAFVP